MKDPNQPWILGLSTKHNGAAALLHGDRIVVAIQEERLLRMKRAEHPIAVPSLAMRYCLQAAGISPSDLTAVALCPFSVDDPAEDVSVNGLLRTANNDIRTFLVPHHLAHAFGAFYMSGFSDSNVLVIDGHGGSLPTLKREELAVIPDAQRARYFAFSPSHIYETVSLYSMEDRSFIPLEKHISTVKDNRPKTGMPFFQTLGKLYAYVGHQIFGDYDTGGLDAAGKVMGLAPYGKASIPVSDFYHIQDGGFLFKDTVPLAFCHRDRWPLRQEEYANLAASAQAAIEKAVLFLAARLRSMHPSPRVCYAGGVALNSVANERLVREAGFSSVFIMPAAEDSGTAIGAAFFALAQLANHHCPRALVMDSMGRRYSGDEVSRAVASTPGVYQTESDAIPQAAEMLSQGKILGWFQGGSELGPRSLGQRSILCDPRRPEMKNVLNGRVKFRESFRPYAPVILLDNAAEWLEVPRERAESPFMLRVMRFLEHKKSIVPAVVHVDGTGRIQTVTRETNHRLFLLIEAFRERTGVPVLLNTSLNTAGEPIAEFPEDALWYLISTGLDGCVLENELILREAGFGSALDFYPVLLNTSISEHRARSSEALHDSRKQTFWCRSGPIELIQSIRAAACNYASHYICVAISGPLGTIVHAMDAKWWHALRIMDGRHTGWQVLGAVREVDEVCSERTFYQLLGRLRLGFGLALTSSAVAAR